MGSLTSLDIGALGGGGLERAGSVDGKQDGEDGPTRPL